MALSSPRRATWGGWNSDDAHGGQRDMGTSWSEMLAALTVLAILVFLFLH
jgi:hypothetical protein